MAMGHVSLLEGTCTFFFLLLHIEHEETDEPKRSFAWKIPSPGKLT